jgi:hypothetical protein
MPDSNAETAESHTHRNATIKVVINYFPNQIFSACLQSPQSIGIQTVLQKSSSLRQIKKILDMKIFLENNVYPLNVFLAGNITVGNAEFFELKRRLSLAGIWQNS